MNRRLGCLTGGGLLAAGLTLAVILLVFLATGGAMFSPGPLKAEPREEVLGQVRSHAETGGRCSTCHTPPWSGETLADRCIACHANVATELRGNQGLHGKLRGNAVSFDCRGCHTEHRGGTADLTQIQAGAFPHAAIGYELAGHQAMAGGRAFACGDCHTQSVTEFSEGTCTDCHRELDDSYMAVHVADFGQSCLGCHDGVDRYSRERFDHNALAFQLQGKHAEVGCGECHAGATTVAGLQGAKGACVDCHQDDDAHQGQFGTGCADCHNTTSWPDAEFDHSKTAFPLAGKHAGVECQDCHRDGSFVGTSAQCVSCHADPIFHQGAFGTACADCHTDTDWQPARFDQRHTFPIDHGEGGASSCRTCHPDTVQAYTCYGCHEHTPADTIEEHAGEVQGDISNCIECHPTGQEEEGRRD